MGLLAGKVQLHVTVGSEEHSCSGVFSAVLVDQAALVVIRPAAASAPAAADEVLEKGRWNVSYC